MAVQRSTEDSLKRCLELLNTNTAHPEMFLSVQDGLASEFISLTKILYDLQKANEPVEIKGSPLEELVVENFDEEQIWQELELQNLPVLKHFELAVNQITDDMDNMIFEEEEGKSEVVAEEKNADIDEETSEEEDEQKEAQRPKTRMHSSSVVADLSEEDSDVDFDVDALEKQAKQRQQMKQKSRQQPGFGSEVDDRFFKLSEMEAFLEDVEKKEMNRNDDDNDVDYFQDLPSGEEDELDLEACVTSKKKKKKSSRNLKYKDFFDPVEEGLSTMGPTAEADDGDLDFEEEEGETSRQEEEEGDDEDMNEEDLNEEEDLSEDEESGGAREALKKVTFDLPDESEGEEVEEIFGGKKRKGEQEEGKSPFEKRQTKMAEKIQELEKAALDEKPWQLTGEATGQTRPENSLLQEDLEFDQAASVAPAITEETTLKLEDIIKQRIKDQVWDDVVRKEKPKEDVFEYKKRLTLDHEKSKLSLAEVYEQEYLKQTKQKAEEEENPAHVEIQKLMDTLFLKLDALSNFHFTPKPSVPEVKVVSNLPSITMEEVAPVSASNATLLAPEEVKEKNKAGNLLGDSEKSVTDKKRERRKKKKMKHIRLQEKEKKRKLREDSKSGENKRQTKAESAESLKKLTKGGKAIALKDDGKDKALRSSQAFFSQLQDQVKTQIKGVKDQASKKKKQKEISASKLKL